MDRQHFNLVSDPWIRVINSHSNQVQTVSLTDLFANASSYRQFAGEMATQDFAVMRLVLAVLHTVYSRFNADNQAYDWLQVDSDSMQVKDVENVDTYVDDLLDTWQNLYESDGFTTAVTDYLNHYKARFDLFGDQPFFQATKEEYDSLVPVKKRVDTGTGTVAVKQINRLISESGNTPAIFAPKTSDSKNAVGFAELTRWLIMYQSFTGVTDKTKIITDEKFSTPAGWAYRLNPVYARGKNLFDTLMQNLVLVHGDEYTVEKPVWEYANVQEYVAERKRLLPVDNLAALYTTWSRIIHIEWDEQNVPTIFSAGLPMFDNENMFLEPMTVWKQDAKNGPSAYKPAQKWKQSMGKAMWRNFGQYVDVHQVGDNDAAQTKEPGIVKWLHTLKNEHCVADELPITLVAVALISDGNATSQAPIAEVVDDMTINADVLFDDNDSDRWPARIEEAIDMAQTIGKDYWSFINKIATIRNMGDKEFVNREAAKYYDCLNEPFDEWLASLTNVEDRELKLKKWFKVLQSTVNSCADDFVQVTSPRDFSGISDENGKISNLFTALGQLRGKVAFHLTGKQKG